MYDDDINFDLPPLPELQEELERRLAEHEFDEGDAPDVVTWADIEAALSVMAVLEMNEIDEADDDEHDDDERPLLLH